MLPVSCAIVKCLQWFWGRVQNGSQPAFASNIQYSRHNTVRNQGASQEVQQELDWEKGQHQNKYTIRRAQHQFVSKHMNNSSPTSLFGFCCPPPRPQDPWGLRDASGSLAKCVWGESVTHASSVWHSDLLWWWLGHKGKGDCYSLG